MKLSQKDRRELQGVLDYLQRGIAFIRSEKTAVMRHHNATSADTFTSSLAPGQHWTKIEKEVGNDFALILNAENRLSEFLHPHLLRPGVDDK